LWVWKRSRGVLLYAQRRKKENKRGRAQFIVPLLIGRDRFPPSPACAGTADRRE